MIKNKELSDPNSCINRAKDDELVFVVREKDPLFVETVRFWAYQALTRKIHEEEKIVGACDIAREAEGNRERRYGG